jgi:hypothetical protein
MLYDDITATTPAFMRPSKLKRTIDNALNAGVRKLLVGYNGPEDLLRIHKRICKSYDDRVEFYNLGYNIGQPTVRNKLLDKVKTKYTLILDDDVYIFDKVLDTAEYLEKNDNVGLVSLSQKTFGGVYLNWAFDIDIESDGTLPNKYGLRDKLLNSNNIYCPPKFIGKHSNIEIEKFKDYYMVKGTDVMENLAMFRTDMLRDVGGFESNYYSNYAHLDFYVNLKYGNYKWDKVIASNLFVPHDKGAGWYDYSNRLNLDLLVKSRNYFVKKWGADRGYREFNLYDYHPELLNNPKILPRKIL